MITASVCFTGGTVGLHDGGGVPLHALGLGSTRLQLNGLHRKAASQSIIVIIDEVEHSLEPHRAMRLLRRWTPKKRPRSCSGDRKHAPI
jgi:putative ATP-dependent endonuclease of OLD family